jgi:phosphomannomutase/phosphoglucomutase
VAPTLAGILLALAVAAIFVVQGQSRARDEVRQRAQEAAASLTRAISTQARERISALGALASDRSLVSALENGDREALGELARLYRSAFPAAQRVVIAPADGLQPRPDANPPIGYALVDLVSAALRDGKPAQEVHMPGGRNAHLNVVAPVRKDGVSLGAVVLTESLEPLRALAGTRPRGRVVLEQRTGGGSADVVEAGSAGANGITVDQPVPGTPWYLHYTETAAEQPAGGISPTVLAAALGGGILLLIAIAFAAARRLQAAIAADGGVFVQVVRDMGAGRLATGYKASLATMEGPLAEAVTAAREQAPRVDKTSRPAAAEATPAEEMTTDWGSGLEVTEEPAAPDPEPEPSTPEPAPGPATKPSAPALDPSILRTYDIRGIVGRTLNAEVAELLGRALGSEAASRGQAEVVVAYDGRHSSPDLAKAVTAGLVASGRRVIDIGRCPTPVMYFATHFLATNAGVVVTGSHNPPEYNGLKMIIGGETLYGDAIQALGRRIEAGDLLEAEGGSVERRDMLSDYIDRIGQDVTLHRPLKIVVDCGNGVAGEVAPALFRALGCEVEELFCEVDGNFPNHHPDPTVPENLDAMRSLVRLQQADLGLAFDGDGDRLGVVDNKGNIIWADRQLMLFARDTLSRNPGADIIFDVKCTNRLADVITENAGVPVLWKTGHSLIKSKLKETGAPLAGEMSGHIFFNDRWYGFDDGMYAAARLLEIVSMDPRDSEEIFAELPEGVSTPEIRVDLAEGEPPRVIAAVTERADFPDARVTTIDGLRVDFPDGWGLVRASNTQPCLVLRFEGNDDESLERVKQTFRDLLQAVKPDLELPF